MEGTLVQHVVDEVLIVIAAVDLVILVVAGRVLGGILILSVVPVLGIQDYVASPAALGLGPGRREALVRPVHHPRALPVVFNNELQGGLCLVGELLPVDIVDGEDHSGQDHQQNPKDKQGEPPLQLLDHAPSSRE